MFTKIIQIDKSQATSQSVSKIYLLENTNESFLLIQKEDSQLFAKSQLNEKIGFSFLKSSANFEIFICLPSDISRFDQLENARRNAAKAYKLLIESKIDTVKIIGKDTAIEMAFTEGLVLSDYKFDKYKSDSDSAHLSKIYVGFNPKITGLNELLKAVYWSRNLVNEPPAILTARELSNQFEKLNTLPNLSIEVLEKKQLESLRMGGILAVNRGSVQEPTLSILTYKPADAQNKQPIVLVGKGVVYDTGGINLKPTGYLETMKSDMSGSAIVAGTIKAIAANKLPVYLIAIVPATDNRPGLDAIVPGDIITMFGGKTVEIINTDAEGRLVLADGLAFAEKFNPQLVISVATLTGSAKATFGDKVIAAMGNAAMQLKKIQSAGIETGERVGELPFWDDYGEEVKSTIADLKNLGGKTSGAITAGKFLENFTNSPYIHLDIAGVSFLEKEDFYRPAGGTGTGIRMLYQFIKNQIKA